MPAHHPDDPADTQRVDPRQRRAQGLRRVRVTTAWTFAVAIGGTAALAATFAQLPPGSPAAAPMVTPGQPSAADCVPPASSVSRVVYLLSEKDEGSDGDARGEREHDGRDRSEDGEPGDEQAPRDTAPTVGCTDGGAVSGLRPPPQPPAPTRLAPRTVTGAS